MDDRVDFDINESLKLFLSDPRTIQTPDASTELQDSENEPENFTHALVSAVLEEINDSIAENPEAICRSACFDNIQCLLK